MCPEGEWEKLIKGSWVRSMSPYSSRVLDIRMPGSSLESLEVSTEEGIYFSLCHLCMSEPIVLKIDTFWHY